MKKFLILVLVIACSQATAQFVNPNVKWELTSREVSDHQFELKITAKIAPRYHLYSQFIVLDEGQIGPNSTEFSFEKSPDYRLEGKVKESGNKHEEFEPVFDSLKLIWFEEKAVFTQRVKLLKDEATVKGSVYFMTCNDRQCDMPSDHIFEFKLRAKVPSSAQKDTIVKSSIPAKDTTGAAMAASGSMDSGFNNKGNAKAAGTTDSAVSNKGKAAVTPTNLPISSRAISVDDIRNEIESRVKKRRVQMQSSRL